MPGSRRAPDARPVRGERRRARPRRARARVPERASATWVTSSGRAAGRVRPGAPDAPRTAAAARAARARRPSPATSSSPSSSPTATTRSWSRSSAPTTIRASTTSPSPRGTGSPRAFSHGRRERGDARSASRRSMPSTRPPRPARPRHVHDGPGRRAGLRRRAVVAPARRRAAARSASTSPTSRTTCGPARALDDEARERATSVYLAGGVVPMLPHALSSDLCSLAPGRAALHDVRARRDGRPRRRDALPPRRGPDQEPRPAVVRAGAGDPRRRRAARAPRSRPRSCAASTELAAIAGAPARPAHAARGARPRRPRDQGASSTPGGCRSRSCGVRTCATMAVIEEFMLLANLLVGEEARAARRAVPVPRARAARRSAKLATLDAMLGALGLPRLGGERRRGRGAADGCSRRPLAPEKKRLLHTLVLRTLARAALRRGRHRALRARRARLLSLHVADPALSGPVQPSPGQGLARRDGPGGGRSRRPNATSAQLALHTSGREQTAQEAERESTRVKALRFMRGTRRRGVRGYDHGRRPGGRVRRARRGAGRRLRSRVVVGGRRLPAWTTPACGSSDARADGASRWATGSRCASRASTSPRANWNWRSNAPARAGAGARAGQPRPDREGAPGAGDKQREESADGQAGQRQAAAPARRGAPRDAARRGDARRGAGDDGEPEHQPRRGVLREPGVPGAALARSR